MKYRIITLMLATLIGAAAVMAKEVKRPESYNYKRGLECIKQNDLEQASDYLNKELSENPKNGYALLQLAAISNDKHDYGKALTQVNDAMALIPKKDAQYVSQSLLYRGFIYENLERNDDALADYAKAAQTWPGKDVQPYVRMGQLLTSLKRYGEADAALRKALGIESGSAKVYALLSANEYDRGNYKLAYDNANYAAKLEPAYTDAYVRRCQASAKLGKWNDAVDDALTAIDDGLSFEGLSLLDPLVDSAYLQLSVKLKVQALKAPDNEMWPLVRALCCEKKNKFADAIDCYAEAKHKGVGDDVAEPRVALCYMMLGDYKRSIEHYNSAIAADSTDHSLLLQLANVYDLMGDEKNAMAMADNYIKAEPGDAVGYSSRASWRFYYKDYKGALDDCNTALAIDPDNAEALVRRMRINQVLGNDAAARADGAKLMAADTVPDKPQLNTAYAQFYMGDAAAALATAKKVCADTTDFTQAYNLACIYALTGDKSRAMSLLELSLREGMTQLHHISRDPDFESMRNDANFKALLARYKDKLDANLVAVAADSANYTTRVVEVPFTKEGGVLKVKCTVNGLPLHFVFDTGASDLTMSTVEATFMLKNDYLGSADIVGRQNYMTANGDISEGTVVRLRNVRFAGLSLDNVSASIVSSQQAPLLLGQSVLNKLGKVEIDYAKRVIRVTTRVRKQ